MTDQSLFEQEEEIIRLGESLLAEGHLTTDAFSQLLGNYKKLLTQSKRLIRMNDRQQAELTNKTRELDLRNQFIRRTFGRYLSDEVVSTLLESPHGLELGGKSLQVTIIFTDLRGFSTICEALPPETVVEMLNDYLSIMTQIIAKHSGTINEFIGDGILILFGAPTAHPDDADRALACAIEMQLAMEEVNRNNREKGWPELEMGVGINTGKVVAGNLGSDLRTKYAVVGSNVNLAARIESFTVGGQILAASSTLDAMRDQARISSQFQPPFKGFRTPITVYEISGMFGKYNLSLPDRSASFSQLPETIEVNLEVLNGKTSSGQIETGQLTHLAINAAYLKTSMPLHFLTNLKLSMDKTLSKGIDLYAKVIKNREDGLHEIRFTSPIKDVSTALGGLRRTV